MAANEDTDVPLLGEPDLKVGRHVHDGEVKSEGSDSQNSDEQDSLELGDEEGGDEAADGELAEQPDTDPGEDDSLGEDVAQSQAAEVEAEGFGSHNGAEQDAQNGEHLQSAHSLGGEDAASSSSSDDEEHNKPRSKRRSRPATGTEKEEEAGVEEEAGFSVEGGVPLNRTMTPQFVTQFKHTGGELGKRHRAPR